MLAWEDADTFCWDNFGTGLCSLRQYRLARCRAGYVFDNPVWTSDAVGANTFIGVNGCTASNVGALSDRSQLMAFCCAEWPKY